MIKQIRKQQKLTKSIYPAIQKSSNQSIHKKLYRQLKPIRPHVINLNKYSFNQKSYSPHSENRSFQSNDNSIQYPSRYFQAMNVHRSVKKHEGYQCRELIQLYGIQQTNKHLPLHTKQNVELRKGKLRLHTQILRNTSNQISFKGNNDIATKFRNKKFNWLNIVKIQNNILKKNLKIMNTKYETKIHTDIQRKIAKKQINLIKLMQQNQKLEKIRFSPWQQVIKPTLYPSNLQFNNK